MRVLAKRDRPLLVDTVGKELVEKTSFENDMAGRGWDLKTFLLESFYLIRSRDVNAYLQGAEFLLLENQLGC